MLISVDFSEEVTRDVFSGRFLDAGRADEEDVEVGLDVASAAHVHPKVWAAAGSEGAEARPKVELGWGLVAGGVFGIVGEEAHERMARMVGLSGMPVSE